MAFETGEAVEPVAVAMAERVALAEIAMGPVYFAELVVGAEPLRV